jgi:enamine deaminase RidA (YjgF/YER057c/UK114 family)
VQRCLRLVGFVNCTPSFSEHAKVINGATDAIFDIFGEAGRHVRAAYGAPSLPFNVAVEIETTWQVS